jgi:hypothetical protein
MEVFAMRYVKEDLRTRRQQFGIYWKTQVYEWLAGRKSVAAAEIGAVLLHLDEFSQLVRDETFEVASERTLNEQVPGTTLELNQKLAERLCRGLRGTERQIAGKAIQEAFLYATGVQYDLPLSAFARKFSAFLQQSGSKGLSALFLRLLVFNKISMSLQLESRAPDIQALEGAFHELDRLCLCAVATSSGEHSTWSKMNRQLTRNLMHTLETQIDRVVGHSVA